MRIELRGFGYVWGNKDGKMFAREQCSCGGCFDNTYDVNPGDEVVSFKSLGVNGKISNVILTSMRFRFGKDISIGEGVVMKAHDKAIEWYCGGQLFDNYGVDGGKSFAGELVKTTPDITSNINFPQAVGHNTHTER